jgi:hypothetical protein
MREMKPDETLLRIREARHRISARFNHDPQLLVAYYQQREKEILDKRMVAAKKSKAQDAQP